MGMQDINLLRLKATVGVWDERKKGGMLLMSIPPFIHLQEIATN